MVARPSSAQQDRATRRDLRYGPRRMDRAPAGSAARTRSPPARSPGRFSGRTLPAPPLPRVRLRVHRRSVDGLRRDLLRRVLRRRGRRSARRLRLRDGPRRTGRSAATSGAASRRRVRSLTPVGAGTRWLDYGCGTGGLVTLPARPRRRRGRLRTGLERPAAARARRPDRSRRRSSTADAGSFDVVTAIEVHRARARPGRGAAPDGARCCGPAACCSSPPATPRRTATGWPSGAT